MATLHDKRLRWLLQLKGITSLDALRLIELTGKMIGHVVEIGHVIRRGSSIWEFAPFYLGV